jgi:hypothetical protein
MRSVLGELVAPALLGAATGLRSQVGVAALLSRRDFAGMSRPWSLLDPAQPEQQVS